MANDPAGLDETGGRTGVLVIFLGFTSPNGIVSFFSGNEFPSLKCLVCDSISMGNGGKVNGIEMVSQ